MKKEELPENVVKAIAHLKEAKRLKDESFREEAKAQYLSRYMSANELYYLIKFNSENNGQ